MQATEQWRNPSDAVLQAALKSHVPCNTLYTQRWIMDGLCFCTDQFHVHPATMLVSTAVTLGF